MGIYSRSTALSAVVGMLALAAAPGLWAQQTGQNRTDSGAVQTDTSGYKGYQPSDTGKAKNDSSGMSQGAPSDTALKAKPGVQTGPSANDTGAARHTGMRAGVDSVVCTDGSRVARPGRTNCKQHGGIDRAATRAAYKARGYQGRSNQNQAAPSDTSRSNAGADTGRVHKQGAGGYRYNGPGSDTALKAKPGVQTGPSKDSARAGASDSGTAGMSADTSRAGMSKSSGNAGMSDTSGHAGMSDSTSGHAGMSDSSGHAGMSDSSSNQTQR
jgi:hypothetical protein